MSYNMFPTFIGAGWDIKKRIITKTLIEESDAGSEFLLSKWSKPHYEFDLTWNYLSQIDRDALEDFIVGQLGPAIPFLLTVVNDSSLTDKASGTGTGATPNFQVPLRAQANVVTTTSVKAAGIDIPAAGCSTPAVPALSQIAGGTKAARTYFSRITYVDAAGGETVASVEASFAVSLNNLLVVTSPAANAGAVSWRLYLNTTTNTEKLQTTQAIGTNYTEPTSALVFTGAAYPVVDTSGWSISATGLITFLANVTNAVAITWSGTYAYLVRFKEDEQEINQMLSQMYEQGGITFRTRR